MTEPVGGLGEEALRLLAALRATGSGTAAGPAAGPAGEGAGPHGDGTCRACPVCRLLAALRATRPEVAGHLEDAAASLLAALQALQQGAGPAPGPAPGRERPAVEPIRIT